MNTKIYRNGKFERDTTSKILVKNAGIFLIPTLVAIALIKWLHLKMDYDNLLVDVLILTVSLTLGTFGYIYRTLTRIRPLAHKQGDMLIINTGLVTKKTIDLSKAQKITCLYISEHNQLMKVKSPGLEPVKFEIKQTNCSTEDLGKFITENHNIEVSYS